MESRWQSDKKRESLKRPPLLAWVQIKPLESIFWQFQKLNSIDLYIYKPPVDVKQKSECQGDLECEEWDHVESDVEFEEVVNQDQIVVNSVVFKHQFGQFAVVGPFKCFGLAYLPETPSYVVEPLAEESHAGYVE